MDSAIPAFWSPVWPRVLVGLAAFTVIGGLLWYFQPWPHGSTAPATRLAAASGLEDPRLTYHGPLKNIHPDVAFVGDDACASCHPKETATFRKHPMGRSILPIKDFAATQVYDADHHNPFETLGSRFEVVREGDRVIHRETRLGPDGKQLYVFDTPVDFVIGSGAHGHSYLTIRDGFVFQTPISWYSQKKIWDLSPGFERNQLPGRPVIAECLFCHANQVHPHSGSFNRYDPPVFSGSIIGCERCHGPGGKHVESGDKLAIVNPANKDYMTPVLRDSVCEQCHLEGEARVLRQGRGRYDFRPGLPLDTVWNIFVEAHEPGQEYRAVSHVDQMRQSGCYLRSSGDKKMTCLTCHDPHDYIEPARQPAYYRTKCLDCHMEHGCTEPLESRLKKSKDDNCVQCHMAPLAATDIVHTASTDHRILRTPNSRPPAPKKPSGSPPTYALRPFYPERDRPDDKEYKRDLAIGLVQTLGLRPDTQKAAAQATPLLDEALRRWPDDVELLQSKGNALHAQGRGAEALAVFEKVLALQPDRESALLSAARLSYRPRQPDTALAYWRRAVAVNSWAPDYRANLVTLLAAKGDWEEVRVHSQAWMRLDPGSIDARKAWIRGLIKAGKKEEARKEFEVIEGLDPNNAGTHRGWFEYQMR